MAIEVVELHEIAHGAFRLPQGMTVGSPPIPPFRTHLDFFAEREGWMPVSLSARAHA